MTPSGTGRPNILLVMADQLAAPFLRCYGGTTAITPAIDRLAAEGVLFESAYSNSPLCAPARFSMMSGRLNSRIGAYDNASEFPASIPTFAHYLRSAGYATSLCGKWGLGDARPSTLSGLPNHQGFDHFFGYLNQVHAHNYYPAFLWRS